MYTIKHELSEVQPTIAQSIIVEAPAQVNPEQTEDPDQEEGEERNVLRIIKKKISKSSSGSGSEQKSKKKKEKKQK